MTSSERYTPTDAEIDALLSVLSEEIYPYAYSAQVADIEAADPSHVDENGHFTPAGYAALKAADDECTRKNRDLYRRALQSAWEARNRP